MPRSSNESLPPGLRRAEFLEVAPERKHPPSWIAGPSQTSEETVEIPAQQKLPTEFLAAMQKELDTGRRSKRPSAAPPRPKRSSRPPPPPVKEPERVVDAAATQAFEQAALTLLTAQEDLYRETAQQLAELACLIARRVIGRELSVDPEIVQSLVSEGLEALGDHSRVVIRLGTAFAEQSLGIERLMASRGERYEVILDDALDPHACLVETELGRVDESVDARLATLLQALKPDSQVP